MPSAMSDEAITAYFISSNPSGLVADDGLKINTEVPNGNVFVDGGNNAVWRALRRNIATPRIDLADDVVQFNNGLSFGATIPIDSGEEIDILKAAHALNPVWTDRCQCPVPTLPAGGQVKISGNARPQMRTATAAESGGTASAADSIEAYATISFDADDSTQYEVSRWKFTGADIGISQSLKFETWIDPAVASLGYVRFHVFATGSSILAPPFLQSISLVWLQVEW